MFQPAAAPFNHQSFPQEAQKGAPNGDAIMFFRHSRHGVLERPVGYNAGLVAGLQHLAHHKL